MNFCFDPVAAGVQIYCSKLTSPGPFERRNGETLQARKTALSAFKRYSKIGGNHG